MAVCFILPGPSLFVLERIVGQGSKFIEFQNNQRMMVDPTFMIVQSLRSFLTAVTPTAVTPIAVILPKFDQI